MKEKLLLASIVMLMAPSAHATDIVSRAETTELRLSDGKLVPRVERDAEGHVTSLSLNDMQLSPEDVEQIGRLEHLRRLVLLRTKFSDRDVARLEGCQSLEHLNLTSTEVTDEAIDTILKLKKLTSLCLGNVNMTPDAVEKLKELNRTRDRSSDSLRWGYSQRRQTPQ
jgi:hypothetical protein